MISFRWYSTTVTATEWVWIMKLAAVCLLALLATPASAQDIFTVDAKVNCGSQLSSVAVSRLLAAGTHTFTLSGAWSPFGSNGANSGNSWGMYMYVQIAATGEVLTFAAAPAWYPTPEAADAAADGVVFTFDLATDSVVRFYNPDAQLNNNNNGICGDNRGAVIVALDGTPLATEESTWGTLKVMFR